MPNLSPQQVLPGRAQGQGAPLPVQQAARGRLDHSAPRLVLWGMAGGQDQQVARDAAGGAQEIRMHWTSVCV